MKDSPFTVVYVVPDKMGGLVNIVANLLAFRRPDNSTDTVVRVHNRFSTDTRFVGHLAASQHVIVEHALPLENLYPVLRRLARAIPAGPGVLVANDLLELALLHYYDLGRTVVYILHGDHDYYYDLAVRHQPVIDVFVTYSRTIDVRLRQLLPNRQDSIFYLPYGIAIPTKVRTAVPGKLRLIFAGRLEHGQKGIFDLPLIDQQLREQRVAVEWTIVGGGPDEAELRSRWQRSSSVRMRGVKSQADTIELFAEHDVFVLPTRAEGFPVALLEAMGAGLVPVVSNLTSGVPEVVAPGVNGYRLKIGDVNGFADAIAALDCNRELLETLSQQARQTVIARFDIRERVGDYQQLFARWRELRQPKPRHSPMPYGSRLDKPWLPNALVYAVRASQRRLTGRALP